MVRYTLSKQERLASLKAIERLFKAGKGVSNYPVRLVWLEVEAAEVPDTPVQVLFSASKKKYSRAVDRNRIKRLLKEGYRLYKPKFFEGLPKGKAFHIAIIYTGSSIESQQHIQKKIILALESMLSQLSTS